MAPRQNLHLTTGQNLVMTPAMQQAVKILELNQLELQGYIEQQLLENPMLQASLGEPDDSDASPDDLGMQQEFSAPPSEDGFSEAKTENVSDNLEVESFLKSADGVDSNFENDFDIGYGDRLINAQPDGAYDEDHTPWEERTARQESLYEILKKQIEENIHIPQHRLIAFALMDHLDDNGWMIGQSALIAQNAGVDEQVVQDVLHQVQLFEPSGIFARNLAECLYIQLQAQNMLDPRMETLLKNLPLLAEGKLKQLKKLCHCDSDLLAEMLADIRRLNPKPAAGFDSPHAAKIIPDVFVHKTPDGEWAVELNQDNLPKVLIDKHYYAKAVASSKTTIDKEYLSSNYQQALWLKRALNQRATTILKVSAAVIYHQHRFLEHGVSALEPLVLQEIADKIEMHPSTVSRATSDKYISTPRGIFEIKYLFQTAIESHNPNIRFSSEAIRLRIKQMIDEEDKNRPISDEALSELLDQEGIKLARRTIAKYREEMSIQSSSKRKRQLSSLLKS